MSEINKPQINKPQINLYHPEYLDNNIVFNFRYIIRFFVLILIVFFIYNGYLIANLYLAKKSYQVEFSAQQQSYNELVRYQQAFPNKQTSLNLTEILHQQQDVLAKKQQVLNALEFSESTSFDGFYLYLEGLANADTSDLWLTKFDFSNAMASMQINGTAKQASSVTAYLKSLQNTIFAGATFNDILMTPYSKNIDAINFEISTKPIDEKTSYNAGNNNSPLIKPWSSLQDNTKRVEKLSNSLIGAQE